MAHIQGDIVIATVHPPRGEVKRRPAVVVTPTSLIAATPLVLIVGISTSYRPEDPDGVPLGWRADGRIHTRLRRDSAAVGTLTAEVAASDLDPTGGHLSRAELIALLEVLKRLAGRETSGTIADRSRRWAEQRADVFVRPVRQRRRLGREPDDVRLGQLDTGVLPVERGLITTLLGLTKPFAELQL